MVIILTIMVLSRLRDYDGYVRDTIKISKDASGRITMDLSYSPARVVKVRGIELDPAMQAAKKSLKIGLNFEDLRKFNLIYREVYAN